MNKVQHLLAQASQNLSQHGIAEARLEAELLLAFLLAKNRAYLFAHPELMLTVDQQKNYQQLIQQRAAGIPIAYITGQREFWSLPLTVDRSTLIPRADTERLVELVLELVPNEPHIQLLDLGTGSGAIALAIASERPQWQINACDKSLDALNVAQSNAQKLKLTQVHFYHSDWFTHLPKQKYHVIVANPPYISATDNHLQQGDLRFEPLNALVSGEEGLADLQYIINQGYSYLVPGGILLVEHGYMQQKPVGELFRHRGYKEVQCWQDIQGNDRVSGGWSSPS